MTIAPRTFLRTADGRIIAEIMPGAPPVDVDQLLAGPLPDPPPASVQRPPAALLPEPDLAEMAVNVTKAGARWLAAGLPLVTQAQHDARTAACEPCEYWDGQARLTWGKCKAPGCGCTKLKRWLATEECKHPQGSRWPALTTP